ncbi:MAG TPA: hypothetical protein VFJ19_05915 [Nocardioidaceae bacterium]|nr:hypothetical protein [Nocardioidaceae bacterium]
MSQRNRFLGNRRYYADDYAGLILGATADRPHMTLAEATAPDATPMDRVTLIRHDIDGDLENALAIARWEARHGVRSTFCVLHTAWYYGPRKDGRLVGRYRDMFDALHEIQDLGHEVALHNNVIAEALRTRTDPYDVLARELHALRSTGLNITGSAAHGGKLARRIGFRNLDLFTETSRHPQTIRFKGHTVRVGTRSMHDFGLAYEGYDIPRDAYITDTGGQVRMVPDRAGRGRHRHETPDLRYGHVTAILAHPSRWNLDEQAPPGQRRVSYEALMSAPTHPDSDPK